MLCKRSSDTQPAYMERIRAAGLTFRRARLGPQPENPHFDHLMRSRYDVNQGVVVLSSFDSQAGAARWPMLRPAWGRGARKKISPGRGAPAAAAAGAVVTNGSAVPDGAQKGTPPDRGGKRRRLGQWPDPAPAPPPALPTGFSYLARWEVHPQGLARNNLRVIFAVKCPRDGQIVMPRSFVDIRRFLTRHSSCMCASPLPTYAALFSNFSKYRTLVSSGL